MDDRISTTAPGQTQPAAHAQPAATDAPSVDDLTRAYYPPANPDAMQAAVERAQTIAEANNLPLAFNWDAANDALPDGYGIGIVPVTQRRENIGNVTVGVYIAGIPDPDTILAHERGEAWARETMERSLLAKLASAVRPGRTDTGPLSVPFSVEDFIIPSNRDQGLAYFRERSAHYVKALNELFKRKIMNGTILRQVLASRAFAEQQFQKVDQRAWEHVLDKMVEEATAAGKDPGIIRVWRDTRNETDLTPEDFDLSELDSVLAG